MQDNDRKLAWAGLVVFVVIALELVWWLFVGPAQGQPTCGIGNTPQCDLPWWDSAAFWTAFFTFALTGSTVLLWWTTRNTLVHAREDALRQSNEMEKSLAIALQSAQAAHRQANVMVASSRAILHLDTPMFLPVEGLNKNSPILPGHLQEIMIFALPIQNVGHTTAIIQTVSFTWLVVAELPGYPPPYATPVGIVAQPIKENGKWTSFSYIAISDVEMKKIKAGNPLWYFGYVRFTNLDETWDVGFVGQWEDKTRGYFEVARGMVPGGPPIYTYTREVEFTEA